MNSKYLNIFTLRNRLHFHGIIVSNFKTFDLAAKAAFSNRYLKINNGQRRLCFSIHFALWLCSKFPSYCTHRLRAESNCSLPFSIHMAVCQESFYKITDVGDNRCERECVSVWVCVYVCVCMCVVCKLTPRRAPVTRSICNCKCLMALSW